MNKKEFQEIFENCMSVKKVWISYIDIDGIVKGEWDEIKPHISIRNFDSDEIKYAEESGIYNSQDIDRDFTNLESAWNYYNSLNRCRIMDGNGQIWYDNYNEKENKSILKKLGG